MAKNNPGVVKEIQKRVKALEKALVQRGKAQQKAVEAAVQRLGKTAEVAEIRKRFKVLAQQSEDVQHRLLNAVGVASAADIESLEKEVAKLSKKIDGLVTKKVAADA